MYVYSFRHCCFTFFSVVWLGWGRREIEQLGVPNLNVSYKPQKISPRFEGTVRQLLHKRIRDAYIHPQVNTNFGRFTAVSLARLSGFLWNVG